jgi:hypothetical protein
MNVRQRKRAIWLTAGALALAGAGAVAASVALPLKHPPPRPLDLQAAGAPARQAEAPHSAAGDDVASTIDLRELRRLCAMDLRRPLFDPPPPAAAESEPQPEPRIPMSVRLVGTIIEPGRSIAMLQKHDGSITLCAEGRTVDDRGGPVKVIAVKENEVTVEYAGRSHTLQMPAEPEAGT